MAKIIGLVSIIVISLFASNITEAKPIGVKMSYSEKLEATKKQYPFKGWRENFKHGLVQYTEENCKKAQTIFDTLISDLIDLGENAKEARKVEHFKTAVISLNKLNEATDWALIETGEREELFELFETIARVAGIDSSKYGGGEGIASEWRDW